jgi:hypothetical protein
MHPRMLAKRELDAQNLIMATTSTLAEKFNVEPPAVVKERQADVAQMLRWEAVAAFLNGLVGAHSEMEATTQGMVKVEDILSIEGLSKTSIKAIEEHFKAKEGEDAQT